MPAVADSSFLISLLEGERWAEEFWRKVVKGEERVFISTVSIAMAASNLWRAGAGVQVDVLVAALKRALGASIVLFDLNLALETGRLMHSTNVDLECASTVTIAFLKRCSTLLTRNEMLVKLAEKYGLKASSMWGKNASKGG
ncbi:MAG: hypothetical protein ACTSXC_04915 [Candidatus Freyarchaeota archaeon]|nr:type II toxin-antitoxin system VapC family toxin [Candidatus Freyrarchaeum guaymaensis]